MSKKWTDQEINYLKQTYKTNININEISIKLNRTHNSIHIKANRLNITRIKGYNYRICSGHKILIGFDDLATTHPELIKEWDYDKNIIKPTEVSKGSHQKVWWICNNNHNYNSVIYSRVDGRGCPYCSFAVIKDYNDFATEHPIIAKEWHPLNKKKPSDYKSGSGIKVWWQCKKCLYEWQNSIKNRAKGSGCPNCKSSRGERRISEILTCLNIEYIAQKRFKRCRNERPLPFDFYLPKQNLCIEYNGEQHYRIVTDNWHKKSSTKISAKDKFKQQKKHDLIKKNFCQENNIDLLIIPYWDFDNIKNILLKKLDIKN